MHKERLMIRIKKSQCQRESRLQARLAARAVAKERLMTTLKHSNSFRDIRREVRLAARAKVGKGT